MTKISPWLLSLLLLGCGPAVNPVEQPPNVVFFMIDDLGWTDLGFMGSSYYETPNIDALALQGMVFTNAYANAPNCAPTRAAFMSGQYAPRHGVYTVGTPERGASRYRQLIPVPNTRALDANVETMAEMFKAGGYTTGHFGKWHLGNDTSSPEAQGFDVSVPAWWGLRVSHFFPEEAEPANEYADARPGDYMADYLTRHAVHFLEEQNDNPFFLYLAHHGVHVPIEGKPELIEKYEAKRGVDGHGNPVYAAMVESIDNSVGVILNTLDSLKLSGNTMIIFFSDNGGYGPATTMRPLRGAKGMLYEGGIRVPMIVKWPGEVEPATTNSTPVMSIDFYPTFKQMAGVNSEPAQQDGESLVSVMNASGALEERNLYWHFPAYLEAYSDQKTPWRITPSGAIRMGEYKLIEFFGEKTVELYNLEADIGEQNNLVEIMPEKADELKKALSDWREDVNAPVPGAANPEFDQAAYKSALLVDANALN